MSTIVTRAGKGSPLTWNEVDNNFTNLNTDKLQSGNTAAALTITSATINGGTITGTALNGTLGATTPSTIAATTISASGVSTFSAGTAGAPALTTTGDTNTGIFFPAADTIAFSEGGTESMRLNSSGNLGLGITPSAWASNVKAIEIGAAANTYLAFNSTAISGSYLYWNMLYNGTNNIYKYTGFGNAYGVDASGRHVWFNAPSGTAGATATLTQAMTIDNSGNLGVGTASPAHKLDIVGSIARLSNAGTADFIARNSSTSTSWEFGVDGSSNGFIYSGQASPMIFSNNGTERMRLDASGNLGLGVTPSAWAGFKAIDMQGGGAVASFTASPSIQIINNAFNDSVSWKYKTSTFASRYGQINGTHFWETAPSGTAGNAITFTQAMTLDSSGNLGLGVTPSAWSGLGKIIDLSNNSVVSSQGSILNFVANAYNNGTNWIYKTTGTALYSAHYNGQYEWYTAPSGTAGNAITFTQAMTLDASGNLLVGVASVPTAGQGGVSISNSSAANGLIRISATGTGTTGLVNFNNPNGNVGYIATTSSSTAYVTSSDYRLKENVAPMTGALATVQALKPVTYNWKADGSDGQGFIAHELAEVVPDCVSGEKDATKEEEYEISPAIPAVLDEEGVEVTPAVEAVMGTRTVPAYQGIDTSFLVATLTAAIQEQQAMIDELKAKVAALEAA